MSELKPCHCGSEVEIYQKGANAIVIHCPGCTLKLEQRVIRYSIEWLREDMIRRWNARPLEDALQDKLISSNDRLAKAIMYLEGLKLGGVPISQEVLDEIGKVEGE